MQRIIFGLGNTLLSKKEKTAFFHYLFGTNKDDKRLLHFLDNAQKELDKTRHNIGKRLLQTFILNSMQTKKYTHSYTYTINNCENQTIFILPRISINCSGDVLQEVILKLQFSGEVFLIVDDVDIQIGQIRISNISSSMTHNGIRSIERSFSSIDQIKIYVIRIGIKGKNINDLSKYVLEKFSKDEEKVFICAITEAVQFLIKDAISFESIDIIKNKYSNLYCFRKIHNDNIQLTTSLVNNTNNESINVFCKKKDLNTEVWKKTYDMVYK